VKLSTGDARMLVLSRRKAESINIGTDILIRIVRLDGKRVRIGINAPAGVRITRAELQDEPQREARKTRYESRA